MGEDARADACMGGGLAADVAAREVLNALNALPWQAMCHVPYGASRPLPSVQRRSPFRRVSSLHISLSRAHEASARAPKLVSVCGQRQQCNMDSTFVWLENF
jgi:hypothetical protein